MNLEKHIEHNLNILFYLEFTKKDIETLIDKKYFNTIVKNSSFLYRCYQNSFRILVIELFKLTTPKEDYSLIKLVRNIILNYKKLNLPERSSIKDYKEMESLLNNLYNGDIYNKIYLLRNKHYAHADKNRYDFNKEISITEINSVLKCLQEIFCVILLDCQNKTVFFESSDNRFHELETLSKYSKIRTHYFDVLKKNHTLTKINNQKVMNIIRGIENLNL